MELRETFNEVADLYDRARPHYPAALFDDVAAMASLKPDARILESGPGTGQATIALAERGYRIDAVELGENLAVVAARNVARFAYATIHVGRFEDFTLPVEPYDLFFAATSFGWLEPSRRFARVATALRPGGWLATINTDHVAGGDRRFFVDVQKCYERHMPGTEPGIRLAEPDAIPPHDFGLVASDLFAPPQFRRYFELIEYTTASYLDVISTYSGHIALKVSARDALLACIAKLLDGEFGGHIRKQYMFELMVAQRR